MEIVIKVVQFILSFSLLVLVHEFGHFIAARAFGIRVDKFYLFFDPWFALFRYKGKNTEFGIGWVPFGGYCKIAGMIDESMDKEQMKQPPQPWEYRSRPAWQRLLVISGGVIMNVVLALCIYIGMSFVWGDNYISNKDVTEGNAFSELGHELGFADGDHILAINDKAIERYNDLFLRILTNRTSDIQVLRGADTVMVHIGRGMTSSMLEAQTPLLMPRVAAVVDSVIADGGAKAGGLLAGDRPVAVNGEQKRFTHEFTDAFEQNKGQTVELTVERDSAGVTLHRILPVAVSDEGKIGVMFAGLPQTHVGYNFLESFPAGIQRTGTVMSDYWRQFKMIFNPETKAYKSVGGPIMIGSIFPSYWSFEKFWGLTAFLSIVLAIFNILPIPALDGGHIFFLLIEVITGRKVNEKFLEIAQTIGLLLLLTLMALVMGNDIYRFFIK